MKKLIFGLASLLLAAVGCTNNDFADKEANVLKGQTRTISNITASMDNADTRVYLDGKQVKWEDGDAIYAFSDEENTGWHEYELSSLNPSTGVAEFSGDALTGSEFYAFYPEPLDVTWASQIATVPWDYEVIYDKGFESTNHQIPMFAKSTNSNMHFKQLGGILHFQIYGEGQLESLTLAGNNGEEFTSAFDLYYDASGIELDPNDNWGTSATITEDFYKGTEGKLPLLSTIDPFDVYFVLPAGMTFEYGFTLSGSAIVEDLDSATAVSVPFEQETTNSFTVTRAEMANFPAFSISGEAPEPSDNQWTLSLNNKSGAYAEVSYNFPPTDSGVVNWIVNFYDAEDPDDQTCMVHMAFPGLPHTGGTPTLDMLDGMRFSGDDFHVGVWDYSGAEEVDYQITGTKVHFDKEGDTWHIYFEDATAKVLYEATTIDDVDFEYTGTLTVNYESLISDDGEIKTYLIPEGAARYSSDWGSWQFIMNDEHGEYSVSFLMSSSAFTNPTVIPTGTFNVDLYVDDIEKKYRNGEAPVTIAKNGDGTYTISFSNVDIGADGSGDVSGVSMTWTGYLDNPDVVKTGEWEWYYAYNSTTLNGAYGYKAIDVVDAPIENGGGVYYKLTFVDYDMSEGVPESYNIVTISWSEPYTGSTPTFPKNKMVTGYIIHVNQGGGYGDPQYNGTNTDEAELIISTAADGTVTITDYNLIMSPGTGEPHASAFSFIGKLNDQGVSYH